MDDFLTDLSPSALTRAITENLYAFSPFSHGWKGAEVYAGKDVCWVVTDIGFPPCNVAFHTNLKPEEVDRTIEKFLSKGKKRDVPLQWCISQDTRPLDLGERLTAHGFTTHGDGAGMAIDLLEINEDVPFPDGLEIIEVKDDKTLKIWCHVACVGFGVPIHADPEVFKLFKTEVKYKQPEKFFLGILDGKPVSTSMYFLGEGVCGIYFVATIPEARNKGIGFAVTQKPLLVAREMGYRVGILQASKLGEPVYRRMGFKEYCRVSSYQWLPESHKNKPQGR